MRNGVTNLDVHMVFSMNLNLIMKSRLVADGHLTPDPIDSTYARFVSRETVGIALTYVA